MSAHQLPWSDITTSIEPLSAHGEVTCVLLEHRPTGLLARTESPRTDTALALAYEQLCVRVEEHREMVGTL